MAKKRISLGTLTTFTVMIGIIVACILMLAISSKFVSEALKNTINDDILTLTQEISNSIDHQLTKEMDTLKLLANNPMLTDQRFSFSDQAEYMEREAKRLGYKSFFLADTDGKAVNFTKEAEKLDVSQREYFKESMSGKPSISDIVSNLLTGEDIIVVSAPVYKNNKIIGVLAGIKNIDFISNICTQFNWKETGIVAIYDKNTQIIGHTNQSLVEKKINLLESAKTDSSFESVAKFFTEKVATQDSGVGEYLAFGVPKLAGFRNMEIKDWTVLMSISTDEVMAPQKSLRIILIFAAIITTVIIGLIEYFVLTRRLSKAFVGLKENVQQLASLDLASELPYDYSDRKNELGDIYLATESLRENVKNLVKQIHSSTDKLTASSKDFSQSCGQASEMASDITRTIDEIAQGATAQASDVQDGVIELDNMGHQMENNTAQMTEMVSASDRVDLLQNEGKEQLNDLVQSTENNARISNQIRDAIMNTEKSVEEINFAEETIRSISEQINLLALNAAIEAARAGEAGKGFAVVAEEIRKLAESAGVSTAQIQKSVDTLSERTNYAVSQIAESEAAVKSQSENVEAMNDKFAGISEALDSLRNTIDSIFTANEKINEAREKVYNVMSNVAALTEENAASTEEISASTQEQNDTFLMIASESEALLELGEDLERIISAFKID